MTKTQTALVIPNYHKQPISNGTKTSIKKICADGKTTMNYDASKDELTFTGISLKKIADLLDKEKEKIPYTHE